MWIRRHSSPQAAMRLICGCTIVTLLVFQYSTWRRYLTRTLSTEQIVERYEALGPLLPADEVTRFVVDECHSDPKKVHQDARLYLAQYAVSPKRLGNDVASQWVVSDSDCPDIEPEMAAAAHWTLVSDLRNGVRLYRTDSGE